MDFKDAAMLRDFTVALLDTISIIKFSISAREACSADDALRVFLKANQAISVNSATVKTKTHIRGGAIR